MREIDTIEGFAEYVGMTRDAVYAMRHRHEGPPSMKIGGRVRYRRAEVDRWLDDQREVATA